jgi:hypothetical protein
MELVVVYQLVKKFPAFCLAQTSQEIAYVP